MAAPFANEYTLRTVAETSSKSCFVCHKSSTKVLITGDSKDFFYICASHLSDPGFATPIVDAKAEAERIRREAIQKEKELVIKEYEERMKRKADAKKGWFGFAKGSAKDETKKTEETDEQIEEDKEAKLKAIDGKTSSSDTDSGPKQYQLHRNFYQMRINRKAEAERAKKQQERMKDPTFFPSVPKNNLT